MIALIAIELLPLLSSRAAAQQDDLKIKVLPLTPHSYEVNSVAFSPDSTAVASGGGDTKVKLWDAATGRLIRTFEGHTYSVNGVAFTPDGQGIVSASEDGTIKLWDANTGQPKYVYNGHSGPVKSISLSQDGLRLLSGGADKTLKLWNTVTGHLIRTLRGHSDEVYQVTLSADAKHALSDARDGTSRLWDTATGNIIRIFKENESSALLPDGDRVITAKLENLNCTITIREVATGRTIHTLYTSDVDWYSVKLAVSPDGRNLLVIKYRDLTTHAAELWDIEQGRILRTFQWYSAHAVAFSPDSSHILAGSRGFGTAQLRLWKIGDGRLIRAFEGYSRAIRSVSVSPDNQHVAATSEDNTIKLWDILRGRLDQIYEGDSQLGKASFSHDGRRILYAGGDKTMKLREVVTGQTIRTFNGHSDWVSSLAFSPDDQFVISGSHDKTIRLWEADTGRVIRSFEGHSNGVNVVAISRDGMSIISGGLDANLVETKTPVRLWDATTGRLVRTFDGHQGYVFSVVFSSDGQRIVSGGWDKTIRLWNTGTGQLIRTFEGHYQPVNSVRFARDGQRVLSGSNDHTIKLWETNTGRLIRSFIGHSGMVQSAVPTPDDRLAVSGSWDTTTKVWDLDTGTLLASFVGGIDSEWLVITPEGFFAASENGAKLLTVESTLGLVSVEQLYQSLYRPDLVREKLAGDPRGLVRLAAAQSNLEKVIRSGRPPSVSFQTPREGATVSGHQVSAEVEIVDMGGKIGRVEWRVNGVTIAAESYDDVTKIARPMRLRRDIMLDEGENELEVVAYNGSNLIASLPRRLNLTGQSLAPLVRPRLFILAVGLNTYADRRLNLVHAVPDARAIAQALRQAGEGLYEHVDVTLLEDADVTPTKLDATFGQLAQRARSTDVFAFFIAGHGRTVDGRYYFIPYNFRVGDKTTAATLDGAVAKYGIAQEQWQAWFARVPARRGVLLFDTCESGTLVEGRRETVALERTAANDRLAQATGRSTFSATSGDAEAIEGYQGHGVFSYSILDALGQADGDENGTIEVAELAAYVRAQVPALSGQVFKHRQVPQVRIGTNFSFVASNTLLARAPHPAGPTTPTHQVSTSADLLVVPAIGARRVRKLDAGMPVTLMEREEGWALIAKAGRPLGYIAIRALAPLQRSPEQSGAPRLMSGPTLKRTGTSPPPE